MTRLDVNNLFPFILVRRLNSARKKLLAIRWVWQASEESLFLLVSEVEKTKVIKNVSHSIVGDSVNDSRVLHFYSTQKQTTYFCFFKIFFGYEKISKNNSTKRTAATTIATAATATAAATITTGLSWCRWIFLRKLDRFFSENLNPGNLSVMQPNKESRLLFPDIEWKRRSKEQRLDDHDQIGADCRRHSK